MRGIEIEFEIGDEVWVVSHIRTPYAQGEKLKEFVVGVCRIKGYSVGEESGTKALAYDCGPVGFITSERVFSNPDDALAWLRGAERKTERKKERK